MDADEKSDPPESSDADFSTSWPLAADESSNLYFFSPDAESNILREFGWNLHSDQHHHHNRSFGDLDQIEIAELGYQRTLSAADSAGKQDLQASLPESSTQFHSPAADADESSSKPSVSSGSSEDPSEKSTGSVVKSPETPNKAVRKKGQKRIKQPRFAFMTKSKVDHLEDGYRWRKYGQKAVKNSPFPRSYYRCTNSKCTVKKRVERSSKDPETVITTYEGQHCHHAAGFLRGGALSAREAAAFTGHYQQFDNYPRVVGIQPARESVMVSTQHRDHVSSSSSANHRPGDHSRSDGLLSPAGQSSQLQLAMDQGLLGDIVPPTMRN